jgi:hypothetical protein
LQTDSLLDLLKRSFGLKNHPVFSKNFSAAGHRPTICRTLARKLDRPRRFATGTQVVSGFMQQRKNERIALDNRVKRKPAEEFDKRLTASD